MELEQIPYTATRRVRDDFATDVSNIVLGERLNFDIIDAAAGETLFPAGQKVTRTIVNRLADICDKADVKFVPANCTSEKMSKCVESLRTKLFALQLARRTKHQRDLQKFDPQI